MFIQGLLNNNLIKSQLLGENLSVGIGELPIDVIQVDILVPKDKLNESIKIISDYEKNLKHKENKIKWICKDCKEINPEISEYVGTAINRGLKMEYRNLGNSGLKISELSFGSWITFVNQLGQKQALECMDYAYEQGINFFDNAEANNTSGDSEILMGKVLKINLSGQEILILFQVSFLGR